VNQKSCSVRTPYNPAAVRAFYFTPTLELCHHNLNIGRNLAPAINSDVNFSRASSLNSNLALDRDLSDLLSCALYGGYQLARLRTYVFEPEYTFIKDSNLEQALQILKNQLAHVRVSMDEYRQGGEVEVQNWAEALRAVMIEYRNMGHDWQFDDQHKELLKQYYDANQLLVQCLNSDCYVTYRVRNEIEESLLLPVSAKVDR
jgi:predicted NACHT family NTPase